MNAALLPPPATVEPRQFRPSAAALRRFALRLERDRRAEMVDLAAFSYGVDPARLEALVESWCSTLQEDAASEALGAYPWFRMIETPSELCFVHHRAKDARALPLLLLHGSWGSLTELAGLVRLTDGEACSATSDAFHLVCPALPSFGVTPAGPPASARELAGACVRLMASLGYERYVVHGSDIGASIAAEVAALEPERVAALHVTALHAYPSEAADDAGSLSSAEKSQLALLTFEHQELRHHGPESPIEDLATALAQLEDWDAAPESFAPLLHSLTLAWTFGDAAARRRLCASERLRATPAFEAPVTLETYPLDAPCLHRLVKQRFNLVARIEHERGGRLPALEQPSALLDSLRRSFASYR